jgi:hypothetical protein
LVLGACLQTKTSMLGRVTPLKGIPTFISFIKEEGAMVQVERRSGKERRSGLDRRRRYTLRYGGAEPPSDMERRSGKDRRRSPPGKA